MKTPFISGLHSNKILFLIVTMLFSLQQVLGNGFGNQAGARQAGMNHCSVALSDFWSIQNNPAGMTMIKNFSVGIGYENRFLIPHTGTANIAAIYPLKFGKMGLSMNYFGYALYHQMDVGLAYARAFGSRLRIGVRLDYLQTGLGDIYGSRSNITFGLGVQADVTGQLTLGIFIFNPIPVKLADYADEKIPAIFRFGLLYHFSNKLFATLEVEKNTGFQAVILRGALEYTFKKKFFFRVGAGTSGDVFSFGFGWHKKHLQFDIGTTMHQSLGFSPQTSLVFTF